MNIDFKDDINCILEINNNYLKITAIYNNKKIDSHNFYNNESDNGYISINSKEFNKWINMIREKIKI